MPENTFQLQPDEHIITYVRKHWIFIFLEAKFIFLAFFVPTVAVWWLQATGKFPETNIFGTSLMSLSDIGIYVWGLFCWLYFADRFTDYALDFWIVTNKRIVESELVALFERRLSTLQLEDIEDITVVNKGVFGNLFNYGRLEVQTAGTEREFTADNIRSPEVLQGIIFEAKMKDEEERKNIEKGEIEQVAARVFNEEIEDKYRKNIDSAIRSQ